MPSERSKPSEMTGEKAALSNVRSISLATCCRPFWTTTSVTGSIESAVTEGRPGSGTRHGVDLGGALGQGALGPAVAGVGAGEHLAAAGRRVHAPGLARLEGEREHRGPRLDAHVHAAPAGAAVLAAEERAEVALEIRAGGDPEGPRIAGDFMDVATVGLALGIQRLESRARPVLALVGAAEEAGAADREDRPRPPAPDQHAVHVHRVVVHVLAVAHVLPVLAAVEAADDAADLDRAVELVGVRGIRGQLEHALGGIRARR